jgi:periplasmic protein TonB
MKRNNERVPEFDEIIFENRNKNYGAYYLRKSYKSTASMSIISGVALSVLLILLLSFKTEKGTASAGITTVTVVMTAPVTTKYVPPPLPKASANLTNTYKNLKPVVTEDTSEATKFIPTADDLQNLTSNGAVSDSGRAPEVVEAPIPVEPEPVVIVQEMPEFPGGESALLKFVGDNTKYPADAQNNNIQGKVILRFVVKSDGSVDRIEVIRGIDPLLDSEAVRVVKTLPRFKPGKQGGVAVPVWFMLPVTFRLENN